MHPAVILEEVDFARLRPAGRYRRSELKPSRRYVTGRDSDGETPCSRSGGEVFEVFRRVFIWRLTSIDVIMIKDSAVFSVRV